MTATVPERFRGVHEIDEGVQLPSGWTIRNLGSLFVEVSRRSTDQGLEVLSCSKIHGIIRQSEKFKQRVASANTSKYKVVEPNEFVYDPMLLWDGSVGRNNYEFPGLVSPAYTVFKALPGVDGDFMELVLRQRSMTPKYIAISEGTNVRRRKAKFSDFSTIQIPLPPLPEQQAIAAALRAARASRDAAANVLEQARELKRSLRRHLFTYGPVSVQQAANIDLRETADGPIPIEWTAISIGSLNEIQAGGTPLRKHPEYFGGNIPWLKTLDIHDAPVVTTEEKITTEGFKSIGGKLRPKGTVLVAMYGGAGTIGKTGILEIESATNQAICCIEPNHEIFHPYYLQEYLAYLRYTWIKFATGTRKDPNISKSIIESRKIYLPEVSIQRQIFRLIEPVNQEINSKNARLDLASGVLRSMRSDFLAGRVRLPLPATPQENSA